MNKALSKNPNATGTGYKNNSHLSFAQDGRTMNQYTHGQEGDGLRFQPTEKIRATELHRSEAESALRISSPLVIAMCGIQAFLPCNRKKKEQEKTK
jgi:hypothetical protein